MTKTIVQKVVFKNTTPKALYDLYMDAKKHSLVTGGPATISEKEGSAYSVHGGYIKGKNIHLVKNKVIVQTWRGQDWDKNSVDSIFSINLEQKGKDVVLHAIHSHIPVKHVASIDKGWHGHYWNPWKQHLAGKPITRPKM
jgi:activator of HSP90 ATPase